MGTSSRWWTAYAVVGLAAVVAAVVIAGVNADPGDDRPVRVTAAIALGAFFAGIFAASIVHLRRQPSTPADDPLFRRLAIGPIDESHANVARSMRRIVVGYQAAAILVTGAAIAAFVASPDVAERWLIPGIIAIVVVWVVMFGLVVWKTVWRGADSTVQPLGLRLVDTPDYLRDPAGGGGLIGAIVYEGSRYGRTVRIEQRSSDAVTGVSLAPHLDVTSLPPAPTGADIVSMTGLPPDTWKGATVELIDSYAVVRRRGNAAGRWMLPDLLLAETVAHRADGFTPRR